MLAQIYLVAERSNPGWEGGGLENDFHQKYVQV